MTSSASNASALPSLPNEPARTGAAGALRTAFSVTGVLPLAVFVAVHLALFARSLGGPAAFARASSLFARVPLAVDLVLVLLPLAFHAAYGAWLTAKGVALRDPSPYAPALGKAMRVTGLVSLAYVAWHVYELDWPVAVGRLTPEATYSLVAAKLSSSVATFPLRALLEVLGEATVLFHLCVGLWGLAVARGWATTPSARRWSAVTFGILGATAMFVAFDTVVLFATGSRLVGRDAPSVLGLDPLRDALPAGRVVFREVIG